MLRYYKYYFKYKYKMTYPYITKLQLKKMIPIANKYKVSQRALEPNQFVDNFLNDKHKSEFWINKRNSFISRTIVSYKEKKTWRRYISLIMWAVNPEPNKPIIYDIEKFNKII